MFRAHGYAAIVGKAGYTLSCILASVVLVASGFAYHVKAQVASIGGSDAISGGPSVGAMNILLMGLESRTDYDGNILPADLLAALHAGSVQGVEFDGVGGQDTNTLILIHIFAGGQKAVGFSIPRDDWVTFPQAYDGQSEGKIDQAYGLAYAQSLNGTVSSIMSRDQRYLLANEAGQAAEIATVKAVTGQPIDHFAEVNLAGFYELAQAFGGIEACVKSSDGGQNLHDANSGANLKVGYQHLNAAQALAFVRERDNLPNGDLDRTHRQQAVIDYVIWKLEHQGVLTSFSQLTSLLDIAKKYVITDSDWQILDFATEMHALSGRNLTFQTLPIEGYQTFYLGGTAEDANVIDIPAIQAEVQKAFTAPAMSSSSKKSKQAKTVTYPLSATTVDVYNAGYTARLASNVSAGLVAAGFAQGQVANTIAQSTTEVSYGSGAAAQANAARIAALFGVTAQASSSVSAGHVKVVLGTSATLPSFGSLSPGSSASSPASSSSPSPSSTSVSDSGVSDSGVSGSGASGSGASGSGASGSGAADNGAAGSIVSVSNNARYGIPCAY
jgi:LCP family protein required for cell wall assembly